MKLVVIVLLCGAVVHAQAPTPPPSVVPTVTLTCDPGGCRATPVGTPADLATLLQTINATVAALLVTEQKVLAVQQEIEAQTTGIAATTGAAWAWVGKYLGVPLGAALTAYIAAKKL